MLKLIDYEFILTKNIITQSEISFGKIIESQIWNQQPLGPLRYPTRNEFPDTFPHYKMQIFKYISTQDFGYETFFNLFVQGYKPLGKRG